MKIIDLLNKIANGEEVPKKIAIQNEVLIYNEDEILNLQDCYCMVDDENAAWEIWAYELNDEVEIIEDEEEFEDIEEIKWNEKSSYNTAKEEIPMLLSRTEQLKKSLNEIIDYINKGDNNE